MLEKPWAYVVVLKSLCSARNSGWVSLVDWGIISGNTLGLKTQDVVSIK